MSEEKVIKLDKADQAPNQGEDQPLPSGLAPNPDGGGVAPEDAAAPGDAKGETKKSTKRGKVAKAEENDAPAAGERGPLPAQMDDEDDGWGGLPVQMRNASSQDDDKN